MARARKCDICKAFYDEYNLSNTDRGANAINFVMKDWSGNAFVRYSVDCCPACMNELEIHCIGKENEKESEPT